MRAGRGTFAPTRFELRCARAVVPETETKMRSSTMLAADVAIGLTAGLVATSTTRPVQKLLRKLTPRAVIRREEQVRPGRPTEIAAKKLAAEMDARLSNEQAERAATAIHYASGAPWGVIYALLR